MKLICLWLVALPLWAPPNIQVLANDFAERYNAWAMTRNLLQPGLSPSMQRLQWNQKVWPAAKALNAAIRSEE